MHSVSTFTLLASFAVVGAHAARSTPAHAQGEPVGESTTTSATADAGTYYAITSDVRRCAFPGCGGWFLKQLNRPTTACHDGRTADRCYAPVLDWSESDVAEPQQAELIAAARTNPASGQVHAIVRGSFVSTNTTTPRPELGKFVITEAWIADGDGAVTGSFVHVEDNGLRCFAPPCSNLTERTLNTSEVTDIAEVDFAPSGLSDAEVDEYTDEMYGPEGVLVVGNRFTVQANGSTADGRTATEAYRRLSDADSE
jgi:hypothetical protein